MRAGFSGICRYENVECVVSVVRFGSTWSEEGCGLYSAPVIQRVKLSGLV